MTVSSVSDVASGCSGEGRQTIYLDHSATTPVDPRVADEVMHYMVEEFGNSGSRTHAFGQRAKERVNRARREVAEVVSAQPDEVIFTSGATESNNLAILGLGAFGEEANRKHIVSTQIEHKAVLEPLNVLAQRGFEVELIPPTRGGWVDPGHLLARVRDDTLLVSVMAANNETGVLQPVSEIAQGLSTRDTYLHVDAAQAFGKVVDPLRNSRIDMLSVSGHKIGGPKGIGALITRRRGYKRPPLAPMMFGGGQERGLRPGTVPVPLVAGIGLASTLALEECKEREESCKFVKDSLVRALEGLGARFNGDLDRSLSTVVNFSIKGIDAEAAIVALKDVVAISNGSACTSNSYTRSHVLIAAGISAEQVDGALRISWSAKSQIPASWIIEKLEQIQTKG
ncbi:cysteine desulfurase DndA [Gordonia sputi]|uniref:cysteine desulfurase n=1 Tax=Gordonia sputi NBRC 100414 TaxID=1089453 RepID=H5U2X9_9ACTN|nr:cysteine desulfurase DndA [Gordonia sputi]NKY95898.1 cysteine desulfurase DndA [Gordonia sputi]GAB40087.1 putative cysteine desulfurase [Gordonia sputi NBRC 100414]